MIVIRALDGIAVDVDENAVTLVSGPYPHDVGPHTYVHGVDRGVLVTAEGAAALAVRLGVNPPLAKLTPPEPDAGLDQGICRHHAPRAAADRTARSGRRERDSDPR